MNTCTGIPARGFARMLAAVLAAAALLWLASAAVPARAENFYDQPPLTEQELLTFIADLPAYLTWARAIKDQPHPTLGKDGRPDFVYSEAAAAKARELGWEPRRFFCVMGRTAAAMAMQKEGKVGAERPADMPVVSPAEFKLVRRHIEALIKAGERPA